MTVRIGILLEAQMMVPSAVMWITRMGLHVVPDLLNPRYILVGIHMGRLQLIGVL